MRINTRDKESGTVSGVVPSMRVNSIRDKPFLNILSMARALLQWGDSYPSSIFLQENLEVS